MDMTTPALGPNEFKVATFSMMLARKDRIQTALSHGEEGWSFDHVLGMVVEGRATFVWNETSEALLELREYPSGKAVHVFTGSGTYEGLLLLYADVARMAKENGFKRMTTLARKGFMRRLPNEGWKTSKQVFFTKEL